MDDLNFIARSPGFRNFESSLPKGDQIGNDDDPEYWAKVFAKREATQIASQTEIPPAAKTKLREKPILIKALHKKTTKRKSQFATQQIYSPETGKLEKIRRAIPKGSTAEREEYLNR